MAHGTGRRAGRRNRLFGERLMITRQPANIPIALSTARRQFDRWRSRQSSKRARLPEELWQKAVALAREHGLNKTACALGLKYHSLKSKVPGNYPPQIAVTAN